MNQSVQASANGRSQDHSLLFKAVFGFAMAFVVLIGAGLAIAGKEFPLWEGIAAGLVGGVIGFVAFRRIKVAHPEG
jgi:hypothetical protein